MRYSSMFVLFSFLLISACGGGQEQSQEQNSAPQSMLKTEVESEPVISNEAGKKVYDQYCLVCHQANGQGVPSAFPPLVKTEYVLGEADQMIGIVLNGLTGEIEVNGEVYNGVMVAHNFLNDTEVADVITFVRSSFGNDASSVTADQVAKVRAAE